jgi:hypothetical protein
MWINSTLSTLDARAAPGVLLDRAQALADRLAGQDAPPPPLPDQAISYWAFYCGARRSWTERWRDEARPVVPGGLIAKGCRVPAFALMILDALEQEVLPCAIRPPAAFIPVQPYGAYRKLGLTRRFEPIGRTTVQMLLNAGFECRPQFLTQWSYS